MQFSYSQIQLYQKCPRQYAYKYIEQIEIPKEKTLHLILGSSVHAALEFLYTELASGKHPASETILRRYQTERDEQIEELESQYGKGRFPLEDIIGFYERGVGYLEWYRKTYAPFDDNIAMATEQRFSISLDDDISFRGHIDRLDVNGATMTIVDYKTSRQYPQDGNDSVKDQINLYALGIQQAYASKIDTLIGKAIYLHLHNEITRQITDEMLAASREKYYRLATEILHKKKQRQHGDKNSFPPLEGSYCSQCPFQSICPVFSHGFAEDQGFALDEMKTDSIKSLIDEYALISLQYNELKKQKDYLAKLLGSFAGQHHYAKLYGHSWKLSVQTYTTYKAHKDTLDQLKEKLSSAGLLDEVLDIPYYKLSKPFSSGTLDYTDYQDLIEKSETCSAGRPSKLKDNDRELFTKEIGVSSQGDR